MSLFVYSSIIVTFWFFLSSWTHQINIPQNDKNEEYSTNDRVSIIGTLHTKPINVNDGKIRQRVIVKAKSMRVRNHERGTDDTSTDVNNVKLLGRVTGKVFVGDGHTLLNLVSMFQRRWCSNESVSILKPIQINIYLCYNRGNGTTPGTIRADFHQVVAFEPSVRDFMRNLQRYDRVYMEGKLAYRKYLLGDNKPQLMGYIIPAIMRKEDSLQAKEGNWLVVNNYSWTFTLNLKPYNAIHREKVIYFVIEEENKCCQNTFAIAVLK